MDDNRNWQGWAALALAGLALVIALFGHNSAPAVNVQVNTGPAAAQPAPMAPPFNPGRPARPNFGPGWPEPPSGGFRQSGPSNFGPGFRGWDQRGPGANHPGFGGWHGFDRHRGPGHFPPFFGPLFFVFGLVKLAGIALLVWLAFRFFRSRHDRPSEG